MLEPKIVERTNRLIEVRIAEREQQLPSEIEQIKLQAGQSGNYNSGIMMLLIHGACSRELEIRSIIVWESLVRVHKTLGAIPNDSLPSDLKEFVHSKILEIQKKLEDVFQDELKNFSGSRPTLDKIYNHTIQKHDVEIDIYCDSLVQEYDKKGTKTPISQEYNFYGSVGVVQSGANAVANDIKNMGSEDQEVLLNTLKLVSESLVTIKALSISQNEELKQIIDECVREIRCGKPNNTKLRTLLTTVATSIQIIASAQPAYQAMKAALVPMGIMLP